MSKTGRNAPCICGSGKKHKKCCDLESPAVQPVGAAQRQRHADAMQHFATACQLHQAGRLGDAANAYRRALALDPAAHQYWSNYGSALDSLDMHDEAVAAFKQALELAPDDALTWNNLGLVQQAMDDHEAAEKSLRRAIELDDQLTFAHFNLGRLLQVREQNAQAIAAYRRVLGRAPHMAQANHNLARLLEQEGDYAGARSYYEQAIDSDPELIAAHRGLAAIATRQVPLWHVPMMNDEQRNAAYFAALEKAVTPSSTVFEIGTGSGLLAMMAARLGAQEVVTCEAEPTVADAARRVIAANRLQDKVTLLAKPSVDVQAGSDLVRAPDVFVTEIFSSELLGERILATLEDAKRRLLPQDCKIIPQSASIMFALVGGEALQKNVFVDDVHGFDLSEFNTIVPRLQPWGREDLPIQLLSAPRAAFDFDFQADDQWHERRVSLAVTATRTGRCVGVVQWLRLQLDDTTRFENAPDNAALAASWTRSLYLLPTPLDVNEGEAFDVLAIHDRTCPWFTVKRASC